MLQRGLFRTVALVVDQDAIRRPWGCLPMACTHDSRGDGLGRSQAAHGVAIALSGACLSVPACRCLPSRGYPCQWECEHGQVRYQEAAAGQRLLMAGTARSEASL